jgi:hypothetical protein
MAKQEPNVFTYPRQEPGTLGHLDLVEPLRVLPRDVAAEIRGLFEQQLTWKPDDGGWCIREIVGHLADAAQVYHKRLYMMSTQTDPMLEPYDQDAFARDHGYLERPIDEMMEQMRTWRDKTVQLLTTLVNWNWARTGRHLETGRVSIRQIVEHMVEHEADHLHEIRRLREAAPAVR